MASKMSEVEFNSELKTVYENIKSSNPSTLATLKSTNESELSTLETKIKGYLDSLTSADTWKDDVSAKIKTASETFTSLIEKCKEPGGSVLTATQGAVTSLQTGLEDYDNKLEELNAKIRSYNKKVDQEPSPRYTTDDQGHQTTTETDAYKTWTNELTALSEIIQHMNDELEELESMCKALIEQIKGLLSALDSEASNDALKLGIEITKQWLPDAGDIDERFKNGGYEVTGTETHDKDGKLVKRTYTVYDRDGNVVQTGVIEYNESEQEISRVTKNYRNGVPVTEEEAAATTTEEAAATTTEPPTTVPPTTTEPPTSPPTTTEPPTTVPPTTTEEQVQTVDSFDNAKPGDILDAKTSPKEGVTNLVHNGHSNVIAGVTNMEELKQAAANEQPIMITSGELGIYWETDPFFGSKGNGVHSYKATPEEPIYLVMDTSGKYMVTNSKGEALNSERLTKEQILNMSRTKNEHNIWYGAGNFIGGLLDSGDYSYFTEAEPAATPTT